MKRQIVHVDENGIDENGDSFEYAATPEVVAAGWAVNVPVTLVFPDGRRFDTNQIKITEKGMKHLSAVMPEDVKGGAA